MLCIRTSATAGSFISVIVIQLLLGFFIVFSIFRTARIRPQMLLTKDFYAHNLNLMKLIFVLITCKIHVLMINLIDYIGIIWASLHLKSPVAQLFFNSLFKLTTKKTLKLYINVHLWGETTLVDSMSKHPLVSSPLFILHGYHTHSSPVCFTA